MFNFQISEELYDDVIAIRSTEVKSPLKPQLRMEAATVSAVTPVVVSLSQCINTVTFYMILLGKFVKLKIHLVLKIMLISSKSQRYRYYHLLTV